MKSIVLWVGVIGVFASVGCTVDAGIGVDVGGAGGGGACEALSCQDALVQGLTVQGDALCDEVSDSAYADLFTCGCGDSSVAGQCEAECGDSLCADAGESSPCGDCLDVACGAPHDTCAND